MEFKLAYSYHPAERYFVGEVKAWRDPMSKDGYLLPANATDVEPPIISVDGQIQIWNGKAWDIVSATKKEFWNTDSRQSVHVFDHPLMRPGSGFTDKKPPMDAEAKFVRGDWHISVEKARAALKGKVEMIFARRSSENIEYKGVSYQADAKAHQSLSIALMDVLAGKQKVERTASDNTRQILSADEFKFLWKAISDRRESLFVTMRSKKEEIDGLKSESDCLSYDIESGW